ncbi:MAG TPA: AAA family ATPase [Jatrophihabitantaceae bacterium]|nr:AAA family ATPase [Jatrophihabitantaceae bacterium]
MPRTVTRLVGRSAELGELVAALEHAAAGSASVVVLDGDAGMGKTRLLTELRSTAESRGQLILLGHCVDLGDAPPPYLPFTEAFARLAIQQPALVDEVRSRFPAIWRLLPRSGETVSEPGDRADRGELFEAVVGAITALAEKQPLLFIVEDVHWADQATRDLLGFLFTRLTLEQIALVASVRSDDLHRRHPLRPTLAQWSRLPAVQRLHLDPLGASEVRELVRSLTGGVPLPENELRSIITRADGNAFFAEELVVAGQYADVQALPWQLADLLLVRLDRLSSEARELVRVAAVAGRRVPHGLLADVVDLPPAALDSALREAVDAHIIEPTPSGRGYTFRHALLAEAVYDDLLPGERVRIHAAFASAVADRPDSAPELARHARASHDLPTAYRASVRAGEEAMAVAAPQEAMKHFQAALEIAPMLPDPAALGADDPAPLVLAVVDAAVAAGRSYRGLRLAREALAALPADAPALTRAQLLYAVSFAGVGGEADLDMLHDTAEALRLVSDEPKSLFKIKLKALYARLNLIFGREVDAERWARSAIEDARELGCRGALADAETTLAVLRRRADEPAEAVERLQAVAEDAQRAGEVIAELRSRYNVGSLYYEQGDLAKAQSAYETAWRRAREVGRPWTIFGMDARGMTGLVQYARGDWDGALRTFDVTGEAPTGLAEALSASAALAIRVARGEPDAGELFAKLRPWWERESRIAVNTVVAMLELHEQHGDTDAACALLDDAIPVLAELWQDQWFLGRIRFSALAVATFGAAVPRSPEATRARLVEQARQLYEDGRTSLDKGLPEGRRLGVEGAAWLARLEAEWARLRWLADVDPPTEHDHIALWRAAVAGFDPDGGFGSVFEQARSRARLAAVLRAAGHGPEAAEQADLARMAARALRAEPLLAEIRALGTSPADRAGARGGRGTAALTDREAEVLALLVEGRTNRQIARQLYISEKTASVHVSNILAKLGVRSRTEAAAVARAG